MSECGVAGGGCQKRTARLLQARQTTGSQALMRGRESSQRPVSAFISSAEVCSPGSMATRRCEVPLIVAQPSNPPAWGDPLVQQQTAPVRSAQPNQLMSA